MARHMRNGRDYSRPGPKVDYELREGSNNAARSGEVYNKIEELQSQIVPTASIESGANASKAYSVGDFFVKDGILYKVTNAIAKGDALTVGTNIVLDTVGSELSSINGRLTPGLGKYSSTGDTNLLLEFGEMSRNKTFANANLRIICKVALPANNNYVLGSVYPRPKYRVPLVILCSNGTTHIGEIGTNGIIYIAVSSVTPANGSFSFNVNYLANEEDTVLY